jgi:hypothetical protein
MGVFIEYPWLAGIIAIAFAVMVGWQRTLSGATAAALWALYTVYEYLMRARILCSGECNIRVDLLLIYPILLVSSIVAIVMTAHARRGLRASR